MGELQKLRRVHSKDDKDRAHSRLVGRGAAVATNGGTGDTAKRRRHMVGRFLTFDFLLERQLAVGVRVELIERLLRT